MGSLVGECANTKMAPERRLRVFTGHVRPTGTGGLSAAEHQKQFDRTLQLPDGRTVGYADYGPESGVPVIMCHGGPGSRLQPPGRVAQMQGVGVRLIGIDRPGYGLSTVQPDRTINDWAVDGIAVADALGLGKFVMCGVSTGGSYALCMAANHPDRVLAVVTGCAMSDMSHPDAAASMQRAIDVGSSDRPTAIRLATERFGEDGRQKVMSRPGDSAAMKLPKADIEVVMAMAGDPERTELGRLNSFANGVQGFVDDRRADSSSGWSSFDVGKVSCPVVIVHGKEDRVVPKVHASIIKNLVPHAEVRLVDGLGHLSIFPLVFEALGEMAARYK